MEKARRALILVCDLVAAHHPSALNDVKYFVELVRRFVSERPQIHNRPLILRMLQNEEEYAISTWLCECSSNMACLDYIFANVDLVACIVMPTIVYNPYYAEHWNTLAVIASCIIEPDTSKRQNGPKRHKSHDHGADGARLMQLLKQMPNRLACGDRFLEFVIQWNSSKGRGHIFAHSDHVLMVLEAEIVHRERARRWHDCLIQELSAAINSSKFWGNRPSTYRQLRRKILGEIDDGMGPANIHIYFMACWTWLAAVLTLR